MFTDKFSDPTAFIRAAAELYYINSCGAGSFVKNIIL